MAASWICPRWELFSRLAPLRGVLLEELPRTLRHRSKPPSRTSSRTHSNAATRPFAYRPRSSPSHRQLILGSSLRRSQTAPLPHSSPSSKTPFGTSSPVSTSEPTTYSTRFAEGRSDIPDLKRGRPLRPAQHRETQTEVNSAQGPRQKYVDKVGIPFGYRRDVAGKWQQLAGLDTVSDTHHRGIWWLWIVRCNELYKENDFDIQEPWRKQDMNKRLQARDSVRNWVFNTDFVGSAAHEESADWKENVKHVLASDACIDFKLARIHGTRRRSLQKGNKSEDIKLK